MNPDLQEVVELLRGMTEAHVQLAECGRRKRDAIVQNDVDTVSQCMNQETRLLNRVAEMEQARLKAIGRFLSKLGMIPTPGFTLTQLIQLAYRAEEKNALREAQQELSAALRELKAVNDLNQQLVKQSLEFIQLSLDVIAGPPAEEATYHHPVQGHGFQRQGLFDTKA
ncbi:flagellar protein FlgN [Paenibacillus thermoaerophilus]|jgi:flagellar biosynthesis/type III secretory pathway chaperone|uniref:Flagellar protein FlgN n=1 Tax=Paenibacillus thermoaerophilus TaxID=1215385 RepID=A0ABW2V4Y8_9BACL|nr:flagellar protein FlgN [Paenibacillus thermoaerophilus]TMV12521.1 flagellar protein FlgN [Paenibacillus thermoaerophilus]